MDIRKEFLFRVYIVFALFVLAASCIFYRAVRINVIEGDKWKERGDSLYLRYLPIEADRGNILAADGSFLNKPEKELNIGGPEIFTFREIAELAFSILEKEPKISTLPVWMIRIILPIMRTFTSSKTYGPLEFMMSVMTMDVVGDKYGKERLEDFFKQNK